MGQGTATKGAEDNRRTNRRRPVMWAATVVQDGHRWTCSIVNMSASGARIRVDGPLMQNCPLVLTSPRFGDIIGELMWRNGSLAGVQFREDPTAVAAKLAQLLPNLTAQE